MLALFVRRRHSGSYVILYFILLGSGRWALPFTVAAEKRKKGPVKRRGDALP